MCATTIDGQGADSGVADISGCGSSCVPRACYGGIYRSGQQCCRTKKTKMSGATCYTHLYPLHAPLALVAGELANLSNDKVAHIFGQNLNMRLPDHGQGVRITAAHPRIGGKLLHSMNGIIHMLIVCKRAANTTHNSQYGRNGLRRKLSTVAIGEQGEAKDIAMTPRGRLLQYAIPAKGIGLFLAWSVMCRIVRCLKKKAADAAFFPEII